MCLGVGGGQVASKISRAVGIGKGCSAKEMDEATKKC